MKRFAMVALIVVSALIVEWSGVEATTGPVPETPYDCKKFPPQTRRWLRYGYTLCMNGPGWQRARIRCYHPQAGQVYIVYGLWVRSHQVNPANDLSIQWCPAGAFARRVRIQKLPELNFREAT